MTHTIWHLAGTTRRNFLGTTAAAGAAGLILPAPYVKRAYAQARSTLIFASGEPLTGNWDPTSHTQLAQINFEGFVFGKLFNTPMRPEKPDEIVWDLALSQNVVDLHTMEYKLRDGVTFHNGAPFTAEDVKATFEYASQANRPAAWYPGPCEVEVVDKLTARVHTEKGGYPASAFYFLAGFLPIMSAADIKDPKTLQGRPNGTGPFKFVEQKGNTTVMAAFDQFWAGRPILNELHFAYIGDATTRVLALLSGEIDVTERLEPEQYETLSKEPKVEVSRTIATENKYLHFRYQQGAVRQPDAAPGGVACDRPLAGAGGHGRRRPRIRTTTSRRSSSATSTWRTTRPSIPRNARSCWRRRGSRKARACRSSNIWSRPASTRRPRSMARSSPRCSRSRAST